MPPGKKIRVKFADLPKEEKSRRVNLAAAAGRLSPEKVAEARAFWKLPDPRFDADDPAAQAVARIEARRGPLDFATLGRIASAPKPSPGQSPLTAAILAGIQKGPFSPFADTAYKYALEGRGGRLPGGQRLESAFAENVVDVAAGRAAGNLVFHGETSHPLAASAGIFSALPFLRGPKAAAVGIKAALEAKSAAAGAAAAGEAYRTSTPIITTAKAAKRKAKQIKAGALYVTKDAPATRTGRAFDKVMTNLIRPTGMIRTPEQMALYQIGEDEKVKGRIISGAAEEVNKQFAKLTTEQQEAYRILKEKATPEARVAHHEAMAATTKDPAEVAAHNIQRDFARASEQWLEVGPDGAPRLRADAPKEMKEAFSAMDEVLATRDDLLLRTGVMTPEELKKRSEGAFRVIHGARTAKPMTKREARKQLRDLEKALIPYTDRTPPPPRRLDPDELEELTVKRIEALTKALDEKVDRVYKYLRSSSPTASRGSRDRRPRRKATQTDLFRGGGGVGDALTPPEGVVNAVHGPTVDRARAAQMIYNMGRREGADPYLKNLADQMDELDDLKDVLLARAEAPIMGTEAPPLPGGSLPRDIAVRGEDDPAAAGSLAAAERQVETAGGKERLLGGPEKLPEWQHPAVWIPTTRGIPRRKGGNWLTDLPLATNAALRHLEAVLTPGGMGRAVGEVGGAEMRALRQEYNDSALVSGMFKADVGRASADSMLRAARVSILSRVHPQLVQAGTELPTLIDDMAIKIDPTKSLDPKVRELQERLRDIEGAGRKLSVKELDEFEWDLIEGARADMFPTMIDGIPLSEMAHWALTNEQPIDNIVWISRAALEGSGLLSVGRKSSEKFKSMPKAAQYLVRGVGGAWDTANDLGRAGVTFLNPFYVPLNFLGTTAMGIMTQGFMYPKYLVRSASMAFTMERRDRILMDNLMGYGFGGSMAQAFRSGRVGGMLNATLGKWAAVGADVLPRRAALLYEAAEEGLDGPALARVLRAAQQGDEAALAQAVRLRARAVRAVGDFDQMNLMEKSILTRLIFFYPWLRVATTWTARWAVDHPMQALGLAMAYEYAADNAEATLTERPSYATFTFPLSTASVGLGIPFTSKGIGLDDALGERSWVDSEGNPKTINVRQAFAQTTPVEIFQTGFKLGVDQDDGFRELIERATPAPHATYVAFSGEDPFTQERVGRGVRSFAEDFLDIPIQERLAAFNMSPEERKEFNKTKTFPRGKWDEFARIWAGSMTPQSYRVSKAQEGVMLDKGQTDLLAERKLKQRIADAGFGEAPPEVMEDFRWKLRVENDTAKLDNYKDRLDAVAKLFAERYPENAADLAAIGEVDEDAAKRIYLRLRGAMYPVYARFSARLPETEE